MEHPLELAYSKMQDYVLTMRSGLGKKIATQGLQKMEKQLEKLRSKENNGAQRDFDPEAVTDQKRAWLEAQERARGEQQLASWPQHLIDHFFVVGLPPDVEITQIAGDLLEKERRQRDSDLLSHIGAGASSDTAARETKVSQEDGATYDSIRMLRGGAPASSQAYFQQPQQQQQQLQQQQTQQRHDKPPAPAYPPQILFRYPNGAAAPIRDREVCDLCFPHHVPPRRIRRSPSWSALNEVVLGRNISTNDDQAFVFMLKAGGNLPLYGICMYSEEVLHRPPVLARNHYSNCKAPYRQCLIAAPRCYCILSQYPFFPLHFQVLNIILSMERLHRIVEFSAEVSSNTAGALDLALPRAGAAGAANEQEVLSPTERLTSGDASPLHQTFPACQMASHTPSQEQWQQQCSESMRHLAQRILDPQLFMKEASHHQAIPNESSLNRPSMGSLVTRSRPSELWEGFVQMLGIGTRFPVPESAPGTVPAVKIDAPLVKVPSSRQPLHHAAALEQQQQQSQRVSIVQQMLEEALMATSDELGGKQQDSPQSDPAYANAASGLARTAPVDMALPACGAGNGRWTSQARAPRKANRLIGAFSLGNEYRASDLLQKPTCFSDRSVAVEDDNHAPTKLQLQEDAIGPWSPISPALQAQASAAMGVDHFLLPSNLAFSDDDEFAETECMSRSWPASNGAIPKHPSSHTPSKLPPVANRGNSSNVQRVGSSVCNAGAAAGAAGTQHSSRDGMPSSAGVQQQGSSLSCMAGCHPHACTHTRTTGFGAEHCQTTWTTAANGMSSSSSTGHAVQHSAEHAAQFETLPPLNTAQSHAGDDKTTPWGPDGKPIRAYQGEDYEQHLRLLLANQRSPQSVEEPLRQHLHDLLGKQVSSSSVHRGNSRAGVYDSCTSAAEATPQGNGSSSNSSTCFASPEVKLPQAKTQQGSCVEDGIEEGRGLPICPRFDQQEQPHHQQTLSNISSTPSTFHDSRATPPHPVSLPPQPPLQHHTPHQRSSSSSNMLGIGTARVGEEQQPAWTPNGCSHRLLHSSSSGSFSIAYATPSTGFPAGDDGACSSGLPPSPARPRATQPSRAPVRGALTKCLQQASLHGSLMGSSNSTISNANRNRSHEMLHHHTRSGSGASFYTAMEDEDGPQGLGSRTEFTTLREGEALESEQGKDGLVTSGNKADQSASLVEEMASQHGNDSEEGASLFQHSNDTASYQTLPRMDTPPAMPSLLLRRTGTGQSGSSVASSLGKGERRVGSRGLDPSQFSSLAVLDTLYNAPLVHPGDCLHFSLGGVKTLAYCRPLLPRRAHILGPLHQLAGYADEELAAELSGWAAATLIRALPLEDLLMLLTAALLEQQLVFFCPNVSMLSACVLGLLPLLRPYAWYGLLMPITPASMACFLEAPVPFVLGWQYKTHDVSTRCTSLVRVNVYKGQVSNASHLPPLPGHKKLAVALAPHHARVQAAAAMAGPRPVHVLMPEEEHATKCFLDVLSVHLGGSSSSGSKPGSPVTTSYNASSNASLLGDLRPYFITNVSGRERTATLMKDWVIEATPSRDRPFVRAFLETQMFQVHSDQVMASLCEGRVV